jgi:hypothetical protein
LQGGPVGWETGGDGVACVTLQGSSVWTCGVFPVWETETVGVVFPVGLPG